MKSVFTKEAKIGLVTIVSLALLYLGINYLKGINLFQPVNHYYVSFSNVKGVTISSPVFVDGFKVGLVRDIIYDYDTTGKIIVEVSLEDKMRLNKGSYIAVVNTFLSGAELHIHLNTYVDDFLKPGSTLEGRMEEDMIQGLSQGRMSDQGLQATQDRVDLRQKVLNAWQDLLLYGLHHILFHSSLKR